MAVVTANVPKGISRLLKKLADRPDYKSVIKTAVQTGFLSDGEWATKLTPDELDHLGQIKETIRGYRQAQPLTDPRDLFPSVVGAEVASIEEDKDACVVRDFVGNSYKAHKFLSAMISRHPRASVHFSISKRDAIYLSEGSEVVACVPLLVEEKRDNPED